MKKYYVILRHENSEFGYSVIARSQAVAERKAVRRASMALKTSITADDVISVTYEGFYLNRRFVPVQTIKFP